MDSRDEGRSRAESGADGHQSAQTHRRRTLAALTVVVAAVGFSLGGLFSRSMEAADPWQMIFYRSLGSAGALLLLLCLRYGLRVGAEFRATGRAGLFAGLCMGITPVTYVLALTHASVANTVFVLSAIPFLSALLARLFLGERLATATWISMAVAGAGVCLMVADGFAFGSVFGNLMALASALSFATFAVVVRRSRAVNMTTVLVPGGLVGAAIAVVGSGASLSVSTHDLLLCLFWGGVTSGAGNYLFVIASRSLSAAEVTLLLMVEYVLAPLWVWLFVNEVPRPLTLLGGAVVLVALAGRRLGRVRRDRAPVTAPD